MLPINKILSDLLDTDKCYVIIIPKTKSDLPLIKFYTLEQENLLKLNTDLNTLNLENVSSLWIIKSIEESNNPIYFYISPQTEQKVTKQTDGEFYTKLLDWQIKQQEQNEDRLDRRLKELLKTANSEKNLQPQSSLDLSGILPLIQPLLQKLQEGK